MNRSDWNSGEPRPSLPEGTFYQPCQQCGFNIFESDVRSAMGPPVFVGKMPPADETPHVDFRDSPKGWSYTCKDCSRRE